ncbi:uncharacterized protein LOC117490598 [Trematomus bernacchii]|uniref:uncharacterized protein LOC117490598 n=1 Tax=Trematomus bernacchii TaxID=40690 RepID=UPI00146CA705|nr:uncharacterized protein LOC117490598 [Trematomus bernacchii]
MQPPRRVDPHRLQRCGDIHICGYTRDKSRFKGFTYIDKPRPQGRGGGIAAIIRKEIKTTIIPIPDVSSFEHLIFKLSGPTPLVTAIIYRPPKPNPSFLSDLSDILTQLSAISPSVLLLGDFNIHVDDPTCKYASEFKETLHCCNFSQHINFPTHSRGHILDLVCSTGLTIHHLSSLNLHISDHLAIIMDINIPIPAQKQKRTITYRNLKSISPSAITASITCKMSVSPPPPPPHFLKTHLNFNPKRLFSTISKLLKPCDNATSSFTTEQCNSFLSFFQTKISNIYSNLTPSSAPPTSPPGSPPSPHSPCPTSPL